VAWLDTVPGPAAFERADVRELVELRASRYGPGAVATARLAWNDPERLMRRFSKNLALLAEARLVRRRRDGYYVLYEPAPGGVAAAVATLEDYVGSPADDTTYETIAGATGGEP
jgi:hypothetical protein